MDKTYHAYIAEEGTNSQSLLYRWVTPNSSVLDVGCTVGDMGAALNRNKNCSVWGIEYDTHRVRIARETGAYHEVYQIELDTLSEKGIPGLQEHFDFIILGDVLEHLKAPEKVLNILKQYLRPNGEMLVSLPNLAHCSIKCGLLLDEFKYMSEGLLDDSHLRFFTWQSIAQFCTVANMKIMELSRTYLGIEGFGSPTDYQRVPPMVLKYVLLDPHSFVCQYVLKLSPSTQPVSDLAAHNRRQLDCVWEDFPDAVRNYASIIQKQVDSAIARENSAQKISSPSLCAHISFFYKDSRIQYLEKEIQGLQTIPNIDIFIHSNLQFSHPLIANNVHLIVHDIKNLHPFFLTWQSRPYFQKQLGQYDYYLYLEDDILFTRKNFEFYLKYHPICKKNNVHLGFLRVECSPTTGDWYILDIFRPLKRRIQLNGIEFAVNDVNPYYAMWILDKEEMHRFIHEYPDCYEFRTLFWGEELNMVRENAATNPNCIMCQMTVVRDEEGADLWHLTNNYVDRDKLFSTLKRNSLLS